MGIFSDLFGGGDNPADAAMPYMQQIQDELKKYLNPYIDRGNHAYGLLNPLYSEMSKDPSGYLSRMESGYQQSPDFTQRLGTAEQMARNAAAAGGMAGTPQAVKEAGHIADSLRGQDMQNWLHNVMGIQGRGMGGLQGFEGQGFNAANNLAQSLAAALGQQGSLAYNRQAQENKSNSDFWDGIGGIAGMIGGLF